MVASLAVMCTAGTPASKSCWPVGGGQVDQPVPGAVGLRHDGVEQPASASHPTGRGGHLLGDLVAVRSTAGPRKARTRSGGTTPACHGGPAPGDRPGGWRPQPAWTVASTRAGGSTRRRGTQSATRMASVTPGDVVTRMSAPARHRRRWRRGRALGPTRTCPRAMDLARKDHRVEATPNAAATRRGWPHVAGAVADVEPEVEAVIGRSGRRRRAGWSRRP